MIHVHLLSLHTSRDACSRVFHCIVCDLSSNLRHSTLPYHDFIMSIRPLPLTDNSSGVGAVSCCAAFTLLSFVFVCARLSTRLLLLKSAGIEEMLILVAWIFSLLLTIDVVMRTSRCYLRQLRNAERPSLQNLQRLVTALEDTSMRSRRKISRALSRGSG